MMTRDGRPSAAQLPAEEELARQRAPGEHHDGRGRQLPPAATSGPGQSLTDAQVPVDREQHLPKNIGEYDAAGELTSHPPMQQQHATTSGQTGARRAAGR